jgi:hypothetical protein
MVARTIEIEPEGEFAGMLDQAEKGAVILVRDGTRFRVEREHAEGRMGIHVPEGGYDAERFAETLSQVAGSISVEDGERMKAYIRAAREAGSRPVDEG